MGVQNKIHVAEAASKLSETEPWEIPEPVTPHEFDYSNRVEVRGKFLFLGDEKLWVRGVTYGTFRPNQDGVQFPPEETVQSDFEAMCCTGHR